MENNDIEQKREQLCNMSIDLGNSVTHGLKCSKIHIIGVQKKERKWGKNLLQKLIPENVLYMGKEIDI